MVRETQEEIENPVLKDMNDRVVKEKSNVDCLIIGERGVGKSTISMGFCFDLDDTFTPEVMENRVHWEVDGYAKVFEEEPNPEKSRGKAISFEELGVAAGRRNWYSQENKVAGNIMQVIRQWGLFAFYNTPSSSFVDSNLEKMFNYVVEVLDKNIERKVNYCRILKVSHNAMSGDVYKKYFRERVEGRKVARHVWEIPIPPKVIIREYQRLEREQKKKLVEAQNEKLKPKAQQKEEAKVLQVEEHRKIYRENLEKLEDMRDRILNKHGGYNVDKICALAKCMPAEGKKLKACLELMDEGVALESLVE